MNFSSLFLLIEESNIIILDLIIQKQLGNLEESFSSEGDFLCVVVYYL